MRLAKTNKDVAPATTTAANQTTGITLGESPAIGQIFGVYLNGTLREVGDGVKTKDFYFSRDGGTTALTLRRIRKGDTLYWTKYRLTSTNLANASDKVTIFYFCPGSVR